MFRRTIFHGMVLVIIGAAAFSACTNSSADEEPAPTTPPVSQPSGIPAVDRGIDGIERGDLQAIIDQLVFGPQECAPPSGGLGGPPECGTGETPGTVVNVVMFASCEGYWVREPQAELTLARFVEGDVNLYGAYRTGGQAFDSADYVAVFAAERDEGTLAQALYFNEDGIVGVDYGCGQSPDQMVQFLDFSDTLVEPAGARAQ